ncbi:hypothetical protein ONA91_37920 [Micromonospora sp. DR5-3]|uniref:hypothetical protein n=1 Tax=unclassified Micromonospora TaxID=2617518 RepID=UPI0011D6E802|nr:MULTISPECIES: hypothetical protein [unclassified Micromonospora]MCW3820223.1 hypothetical protein [Micromonospora sp. DR5-3]TYC19686.1 hypothetical protein FXF52_35310 [Micromonospora sp. MP36]
MSLLNTINGWRTKVFVWIGLPVIAAIGLMMGATDLAPAWQAKNGGGTAGTFTAVHEECGRRNCEWRGDFVATEGGARRADVILYDAPDGLTTGATAPARDTGARAGVFSTAGGSTYLLVTGLTAAGVAALVAWVWIIVRAIRRRRETSRPATPPASFAPSA